MRTWNQNHEKMQKNSRTKLAVAVRSIQWSYGIFWSFSTSKEGVLEWSDGYYNGDIKTRKTVQSTELLKADKIGLQRSEQLRELYTFLHEADTDAQAKRPSAALSPEDLTDLEWYYLVCMSFVFKPSESLPGRALESAETIWLCDAQYADSKIFSRSLLAKSASIQTVVCFPFLEGVIEIGTNEMVFEDPSLIQHVKACFLDFSKPICSDKSISDINKADDDDDDKDPTCTKVENGILSTMALENLCFSQEEINFNQEYPIDATQENNTQDFNTDSPDEWSIDCEHQCRIEHSMVEVINGGSSQVNCQNFLDDGLSNCFQDSLSPRDCVPDAFDNQDEPYRNASQVHLKEIQDCNHSKLSFFDIGADEELYYKRTLSAVLGNSSVFKENVHNNNSLCKSSFVRWKKGEISERLRSRVKQSKLKKILFHVPCMHSSGSSLKSQKGNDQTECHNKLENGDNRMENMPCERRESENFQLLRSTVPYINEVDEISILGDTIKYLKELEARVEELESCMDISDSAAKTRRKQPEVQEQISDNYETGKTYEGRKTLMNKRKASDIDEKNKERSRIVQKDGIPLDVKVKKKDEEISIEMKCPYREYILLDIMDAINNLYLDAHTIQSVTVDGVLILTLKSKFRGAAIAPLGMIKEALWKVSCKF